MKEQLETVYKETDVEILISTMNKNSLDFLIPMFPFSHFSHFSILIVNQTNNDQLLVSDYPNVRVFNSFETGLSKSRNLALKNATGKILLIADDDVVYQEDFLSKIITSHNDYKNAAAITFSAIQKDDSFLKKYPLVPKTKLNSFDIFNTSSIEITLKKDKIEHLEIEFDENFGLRSAFEMGEEVIFLFDLKNKKEQLVFIPEVIVSHDSKTTSKKEVF
ncbi:glycosyl transferase family 2 [Flavobacterium sp. 81]|uniref:glycosyltransferase family 2 protein n=1 Tax=Flavobacterium sp. 81 TaxID=2135621 RepID=UPI000EAB8B9C|nr:glycosyltransferase family 2 protein [Flavobacterium sp. 81]RKR08681.1 glycosyl transferase family 2 [Flavobacterium sp. 81]